MRIAASDRLQNGNGRGELGRFVASPELSGSRDGQQIVSGSTAGEYGRCLSGKAHCEMNTTPIRINPTPAQRRQSTASFNSTLARRVSGINAAADIGTAKLMGAIETSFINEKNETAIAHVEIIT